MHAARVEKQSAIASLDVRPVRVAKDDHVGAWKAPAQSTRQTGMGEKRAERQSPEQGLRLLEPAAAIAMNDDDAPALDGDLPAQGQGGERSIVVAANGLDRRDATQLRDGLGTIDVPGVNDQVHAAQDLEEAFGQMLQELRAVRVRNDSDSGRQAGIVREAGRNVRSTINGAKLRAAAMPNTAGWPAPKAAAPMSGPTTPPR